MKLNLNTGLSALPKIGAGTGPAPFPNTKSTDFDGADDYIDCGDITAFNGATEISCFAWIKIPTLAANKCIMAKWDYQTQGCFGMATGWTAGTSDELIVTIATSITDIGGSYFHTTNADLIADTWHYVGFVFDGSEASADRVKIYVDGDEITTTTGGTIPTSLTTATSTFKIGEWGGSLHRYFNGNIDEVSVFDEVKSASDLYNSGTPTNLASESGLVFWNRLGDSAVFNADSQWEFPEQTKINNWSSHSFSFDGVNDYVSMGNPTELQITGALTLSAWIKTSFAGSTTQGIIYKDNGTTGNRDYKLQLTGSGQVLDFRIFNSNTAYSVTGSTNLDDGNWHHVLAVFTPSTSLTVYVDGSQDATNTTSIPTTIDNDAVDFEIGRRNDSTFYFDGNIDGVAIFDTELTSGNVTSIFASGVPNDVSDLGISGLQGYWRMGEGASFAGGNWTIPDASTNSNDGTSANMNEADNVNNAPDNENQGLSVGMISGSVVEETP